MDFYFWSFLANAPFSLELLMPDSQEKDMERYMTLREWIVALQVRYDNLETNQGVLKKDVDDRFDKTDKKIEERFDKLYNKLEEILKITNELKADKQAVKGGWKVITVMAMVTAGIYTMVLQFVEYFNK